MQPIFKLVVFSVIAAGVVPRFLHGSASDNSETLYEANVEADSNQPATAKAYRDSMGHFSFSARMNGKRVNVLVDTGATTVAINRSTAHRIGMRFGNRGTTTVGTANGTIKADRAVIKKIQIDGIIVRNVPALVLADSSLDGTLLGMSFMKKLKKFEVNGRTLKLTQ